MQSESLIFIWMLHLTFFIFSIFCFVQSLSEGYKNIFFLEISTIFLYNFCLFPRHPTFFFGIGIWYRNFFILIRLSPWRTISRLFQRSFMFANLSYLSSTWHLERAVWRNKNEKKCQDTSCYKTPLERPRTPVGRRAASKRVRTHCSRRKPLATEETITR